MAYCVHCGKELDENSKFCGNCGAPQEEAPAQAAPVQENTVVKEAPVIKEAPADVEKAAIAEAEGGFGKALASVICACFPIASIIAIVLGSKSLKAWKKAAAAAEQNGFQLTGKSTATRILALIGKIAGIVMTVIYALYFIIILAAIG